MYKQSFLKTDLINALQQIDENQKPLFGKMNYLQMIEHLVYSVQVASGKLPVPEVLTGEMMEKAKAFMLTEKPFKENTPNQLLPTEPTPAKYLNKNDALQELQNELNYFFEKYTNENNLKIQNAFFGTLNFEEQVHLLHKHFVHHLKQFNFIVN